MKKIIAVLAALTTVFCVFTACGKAETESGKDNDKADKEVVSDSPEEDGEEENETEKVKPTMASDDTETVSASASVSEAECKAVYDELLRCYSANDGKGLLGCALPSDIFPVMDKYGFTDDMLSDGFGDDDDLEYEIISITDATDKETEDCKYAVQYYAELYYRLNEAGISPEDLDDLDDDNVYDEKYDKLVDVLAELDDDLLPIDGKFRYDPCIISCVKVKTESGDGYVADNFVYKTKSGEVKVDLLTNELIKEKYRTSCSAATNLKRAINAALTEIEEPGGDISGTHIICKDSSKNIGDVNGNYEDLCDTVKVYFQNIDLLDDWFAVIHNEECEYAVCSYKDVAGQSVSKKVFVGFDGDDIQLETQDGFMTVDELYEIAADAVK